MIDDTDDFDTEKTTDETPAEQVPAEVKIISTIDYWYKNYGRSCEGNDQKAVRIFREYEPHERLRRLQNELQQVKDQRVSIPVLDTVVGKKRMQKYQGYDLWAGMMLRWIAAKR